MKKSLIFVLVAALFLFAACGSKKKTETEQESDNTDIDKVENQETEDEESSDAEQQTGDVEQNEDAEQDTDSELNDNDSENAGDSDAKTNDVDFEESPDEFCNSEDVPKIIGESCPKQVNKENYWLGVSGESSDERRMIVNNVKYYTNTPYFSMMVIGPCGNESGDCSIEIAYATDDLIKRDNVIGKKWHLKSAEIVKRSGVVKNFWPETKAAIVTDKNGGLVALSAQNVYGQDIGEKFTVKEFPELDIEMYVPENCATYNIYYTDDDGNEVIDVRMAPPLKFTRNCKSVIVRNWESVEMDGYIYSVKTSVAAHETDSDHKIFDSGSRYYFEFSVFSKKAFSEADPEEGFVADENIQTVPENQINDAGAECDPETFVEHCEDNIRVYCPQNKQVKKDNCGEKVCMTTVWLYDIYKERNHAGCYKPCNNNFSGDAASCSETAYATTSGYVFTAGIVQHEFCLQTSKGSLYFEGSSKSFTEACNSPCKDEFSCVGLADVPEDQDESNSAPCDPETFVEHCFYNQAMSCKDNKVEALGCSDNGCLTTRGWFDADKNHAACYRPCEEDETTSQRCSSYYFGPSTSHEYLGDFVSYYVCVPTNGGVRRMPSPDLEQCATVCDGTICETTNP